MKEYVLNYCLNFECVAGDCKHSCCKGWEIFIDENTLDSYKSNTTVFSSTLKNGINFKRSKFKTDKRKKCAFLNDVGLCDIITNLGKDSLCQVCRDHPRFRSFFGDRIEMGLGFCCEEATRIILSYREEIEPVLISDDGGCEALDFNQKNLLEFRKKALDIVQDETLTIGDRVNMLLKECKANVLEKDLNKTLKTFLSFEIIDKEWVKRLKGIDVLKTTTESNLASYFKQFMVNSLYRHLSDAEDTVFVRARAIACVISWWIINSVFISENSEKTDDFILICDIVRAFSTEVEYSQKNLNKLYDLCYKFIKI